MSYNQWMDIDPWLLSALHFFVKQKLRCGCRKEAKKEDAKAAFEEKQQGSQ